MSTAWGTASKRGIFWPIALVIAWCGLTVAGLGALWLYSQTPGQATYPSRHWPKDVPIEPASSGATLVMFVHPHCPCTRASMGELERIVAHTQGKPLTLWVVFYKPAAAEDGWEQTDLWRTAEAIPGAHVAVDTNGDIARRFHAATSGQTLLYDAQGNLVFQGGITAARGHAGDNAGETAIVDFVKYGPDSLPECCRETPSFGCPIIDLPTNN